MNEVEKRFHSLEKRIYALERLIYGQVLLDKRIDIIEAMIDADELDEARLEINGLLHYLGDAPILHGLIARIDTIEFLRDSHT